MTSILSADRCCECCLVLQALFDLQLSSIKHYNIATFVPDVKVHYIVHRYAQLTSSLLSLNADYQVHTASLLEPCHSMPRTHYALERLCAVLIVTSVLMRMHISCCGHSCSCLTTSNSCMECCIWACSVFMERPRAAPQPQNTHQHALLQPSIPVSVYGSQAAKLVGATVVSAFNTAEAKNYAVRV